MKLAIYVTATTGYTYALEAQARKIVAGIRADNRLSDSNLLIMIVTDDSEDKLVKDAIGVYSKALPAATIEVIANKEFGTGFKNYGTEAQLLIAQMRTAASTRAVAWDADYCLSLDCDVLPPPNAIRCMIDMLAFDNGYYGAAFCPYPSHGGGPFMGGRGSPQNPIFPDFYPEERNVPEEMKKEKEDLMKSLDSEKDPRKHAAIIKSLQAIHKLIMTLPPKKGLFACMAEWGWKRRGWFDYAYPAIGKGSCVPVDWTGFGCLMAGKAALALCDWVGYDGQGTEDLFINYHRWMPAGVKMVCIPHCPCDHIVRKPNEPGHYVHIMTYHEEQGEFVNHLRQRTAPWHPHAPGERHNPKNDGLMMGKPAKKKSSSPPPSVKKRTPLAPIKSLNKNNQAGNEGKKGVEKK